MAGVRSEEQGLDESGGADEVGARTPGAPVVGRLKVLEQAKALGAGTDLVFPGLRGRRLGDATLSLLLRRLEMPCVPHGMRSSFRDWCSETGVAREVAEASLAHVVKNKVEAAYARSDLLEQRREVMEGWSDYLLR